MANLEHATSLGDEDLPSWVARPVIFVSSHYRYQDLWPNAKNSLLISYVILQLHGRNDCQDL